MSWDFSCLNFARRPGEQKHENFCVKMSPSHEKTNVIPCRGSILLSGRKDERKLFLSNTERSHVEPQQRRRKEQSHFTTGQDIQTSPHWMSRRKVLKMERRKIGITRRNRWRTLNLASHSATDGECPHQIFLPIFIERVFVNKEENNRNQQEAENLTNYSAANEDCSRFFCFVYNKIEMYFFPCKFNGKFFERLFYGNIYP